MPKTLNRARAWLLLSGAIIFEVSASLGLKGAVLNENLLFILFVICGYIASFTFLAFALNAGFPIGIAYGIWGASGVALTALLSSVLFGEQLSPLSITGIVTVVVGVLLVEFGSRGHAADTASEGAGDA